MNILRLGKHKPSRPKTRKRKTKAEKRKDWAEERLMARAQTDPRAESAMILKETGVDIPPIDEVKQEERKLDEKITKMAFEEIESDEVLKKRATAMKIERILGGDSRTGHGEEGEYYPFEGERSPLDIIRDYRQIEAEFGEGTGVLAFLKDPGVWQQALALANRVLGKDVADGEGRMVSVEVDGQLIEMSPQAYQTYSAQREQLRLAQSKLKQLSGGEAPDVETEEQPDGKPEIEERLTVEDDHEEAGITPIVADKQSEAGQAAAGEVKPAEVDIREFLPFVDEIVNAMEGTPQQFAEDLAASAKGGNQDAQMLLLFLSTVTYDQLIELVKPYEQTEGLFQYINKLEDSKEWVEEALASIRQLAL